MVKLGILLTHQHRILSVAALIDLFETANRFCEEDGKKPPFLITLVNMGAEHALPYGMLPVYTLKNIALQDIILIPAFRTNDIPDAIRQNQDALPWLKEQYELGTHIASFCTGAFLLGAAGLLNGKEATTHVEAANVFTQTFPDVNLKAEEVTTFQQGIYTSGGAINSFHLMLRILEHYCGIPLTIRVAKYFAIDMNRGHQAYFSTFRPLTNHKDELVALLQKKIEERFKKADTIEDLMEELPASRRNLTRRFKAATGITPIAYLQKTRIEAAKGLLEQTDCSILEVMLAAGYNDQKTFRQIFRKNTGMTPTAYREKFYSRKSIELI